MPRNAIKNAEVRNTRKSQILNAALTVYTRYGYYGTDMDAVAKEANLAKGLLYYYYKTKKELFMELYSWRFQESYSFSEMLLNNTQEKNPVEQLMYYVYAMFGANKADHRFMQFNMRIPFDAYAIFGPEEWKEGAAKSDTHRGALADIIQKGIDLGLIPNVNADNAANSFWTVFVANVFTYSKMITGEKQEQRNEEQVLRDVVRFCFQGLGIEYTLWNSCLEAVIVENRKGEVKYESV